MPSLDAGDVTVVVVTYNSAHCLPTLSPLLATCPQVVISDNGSDDETGPQAQALWPHATVLAHGRNLGFGAANNRALAQVKTPFALLLNPDCDMTPQALQALLTPPMKNAAGIEVGEMRSVLQLQHQFQTAPQCETLGYTHLPQPNLRR